MSTLSHTVARKDCTKCNRRPLGRDVNWKCESAAVGTSSTPTCSELTVAIPLIKAKEPDVPRHDVVSLDKYLPTFR